MELRYSSRAGAVVAKTHHKYYPEGLRTGSSPYIEIDLDKFDETTYMDVLSRITGKYCDTSDEKFLQHKLFIKGPYIDTEFQFAKKRAETGNIKEDYLITRIDLTKLVDGHLTFVELKKIDDPRMLHRDTETGKDDKGHDIRGQIKDYKDFISANKVAIHDYYGKIAKIMYNLGINPKCFNSEELMIQSVSNDVELLIFDNYHNPSPGEKNRKERLTKILDEARIKYSFYNN